MEIEKIIEQNGLAGEEGTLLVQEFTSVELTVKEWKEKAFSIVVADKTQVTEMQMAKIVCKKFSEMRLNIEQRRKEIGDPAFRKYKAINAIAKYYQALIEPIEKHLKLQADFLKIESEKEVERLRLEAEVKAEEVRIENERKEKLLNSRRIELARYAQYGEPVISAETTEEQYQVILSNLQEAKNQHEVEQEQVRLENKRLEEEATAREAQMLREREVAAAKLREQEEMAQIAAVKQAEKIELERKTREAQMLREREEAARQAAIQAEKIELERKAREAIEQELQAQKDAKEKSIKDKEIAAQVVRDLEEKAQKQEAYQKWLLDNNFDSGSMRVVTTGRKSELWLKISEYIAD